MRVQQACLVVAWVFMTACDVTVPGPPTGARRFTPPAQYRAWWALTEACSGHVGDFSGVRWNVLPSADAFSLEGQTVNGAWYPTGNQIVLGDSEESNGPLVRHEMLHALLHDGTHPRQEFLGSCGDIVVCVGQCVTSAGGPPDTAARSRIVAPDSVAASIVIAPDTVSISEDSGWVSVAMTVTNLTNHRGRLQVPTDSGEPETVILMSGAPGPIVGSLEFQMEYYMAMAPAGEVGSTRRVVFDARVPLYDWKSPYVFSGGIQQDSGVVAPAAPPQALYIRP